MDTDMALTRRKFLAIGSGSLVAISLPLLDAYTHGRHHLTTLRQDIYIPDLPDAFAGFTIAQLSDFHFGFHDESDLLNRAIDIVNSLNPSMVALTGDFITSNYEDARANVTAAHQCTDLFRRIKAPLRFASYGNHDMIAPRSVADGLRANGITLLRNAKVNIQQGGETMWLGGIADSLTDFPRDIGALPQAVAQQPVILLGHEPSYATKLIGGIERNNLRCDLFLTGHTHGGQINLPIVTKNFAAIQGERFLHGGFSLEGFTMYVNRGLGTIHIPMRLNAPPEVTLLTLRRG
jgi:predicted MPP superfamily phosphohydrolase